MGGVDRVAAYTYDAQGRVATVSYPVAGGLVRTELLTTTPEAAPATPRRWRATHDTEPIILAELQRGGPPLWVSRPHLPQGLGSAQPANLQSYVRRVAGAGDTGRALTATAEPWSKTVDAKLRSAVAQNVASITAKLTTPPRKTIIYCPTSRTVKAPFSGWLRARIMGRWGGAASRLWQSILSNGAAVALVRVEL